MKSGSIMRFIVFMAAVMPWSSCTTKYGPDIYTPDNSFKIVGYIGGGNIEKLDSIELGRLTYLNLFLV